MIGQIELNQWHGAFFDALESQNIGAFGNQLLIFLAIVAGLLAMVVGQTWIQEMLKVRLREWLTHHLLDEWLIAGRAYRLGLAGQIGVNPDQPIEEDTKGTLAPFRLGHTQGLGLRLQFMLGKRPRRRQIGDNDRVILFAERTSLDVG